MRGQMTKSFVIFLTFFFISFSTADNAYSKTLEQKRLEACLDKFFASQVPLGKISLYEAWVEDVQNSKQAAKICASEINAFLANPGYELDPDPVYVSELMWVRAMGILKMSFKPNQREGKKRMIASFHGAPIGDWWALKKK